MQFNKEFVRNLTLLVGSWTTILAAAILAPALPGMASHFNDVPNAEFLVRLSLTMPALFIALGAPFAGILLDRLGRKPIIIASLVLYGFSGTAGFFLESLTAILVSRAILGIAAAGLTSGLTTLIADYFTGERLNQFLGYQAAFIGIGGVIFQYVSGVVADIGWRFPFSLYLIAFIILPMALLALDEPDLSKSEDATQQDDGQAVFPLRQISPVYLIAFVGMFIFFAFPVLLPFFLTAESGASNTQVGLALSLSTLTSIVSALAFQRLKQRFPYRTLFAIIFLTLGINHLVVANFTAYTAVVVGILIGGLGIGLFPPALSSMVSTITPAPLRGRAFGGLTAALFAGQFFTPIFTQPLVDSVGLSETFRLLGIIALLITVIFSAINLRRNRRSLQEQDSG